MDKTCAKCGRPVAATFKMCPACGSKAFQGPASQTPLTAPRPPLAQAHSPVLNVPPPHPGGSLKIGLSIGAAVVVVVALVFFALHLKDQSEIKKAEALARIEAESKRADIALELERQRLATQNEIEIQKTKREAQEELDRVRAANAEKEQRASNSQRANAERSAILRVEKSSRRSLMDKETKVLQLRNISDTHVDFHLKCCTVRNDCKTLFVSIPARSEKEFGFLEGWSGNFVKGETCEAKYQDEVLWNIEFQ